MEILMIRHGQSEADILNMIEGRADFPLTELGGAQAKKMAGWVSANYRIGRILSSPLRRAAQTAQSLADAAGIPLELEDNLMEWQNGLIAGLPYEEANRLYPPPAEKHPHTTVYGQESEIEFRARAETALSRILYDGNPEETIAVVSHGGMINMLLRSFLRLPVDTDLSFTTGDTGIHHCRADKSGRRIVFINRLSHLDS